MKLATTAVVVVSCMLPLTDALRAGRQERDLGRRRRRFRSKRRGGGSGSKSGSSSDEDAAVAPPEDCGGQSLIAYLGPYPGYAGNYGPADGTITVRFNPDCSLLFYMDASGLESDTFEGGAHIHTGTTCEDASLVGGHYWNADIYPDDPWTPEYGAVYWTSSAGTTMSAFALDSGYGYAANVGHAVVLHESDGTRVACGVLLPVGSTRNLFTDSMGSYPGYMGDADVRGSVDAYFYNDDTLKFSFSLSGLDPNCVNCGIHIHTGTTCEDADMVGGHYWDNSKLPDLWTTEGRAVYNSDEDGNAEGYFFLYSGYGYEDNIGHAVVVHTQDGSRIGCGILEA